MRKSGVVAAGDVGVVGDGGGWGVGWSGVVG